MKKAASTILSCLKEKQMTQTQLAEFMGEDIRVLSQQLNKQIDFKVERFIDVLDHIGYRVEIVDNGGIRKVSKEYAKKIIDGRQPIGLFWFFENDKYIGIDNEEGEAFIEEFSSKEECFKWLREQQ